MSVITRFAPSPTGFLHIGGARTALFNYLFAKHHHGQFLLRIEDTDKARSTPEATQAILDGLQWLELTPDAEPVYQAERAERHQEIAIQLLESGHAYRCYTSAEELQTLRDAAQARGEHFRFQSPWRDCTTTPPNAPYVVRLKAPQSGVMTLEDAVQGSIDVAYNTLDDMVLLRADGSPTYMLAVVVDDHDMGITHIIRGDDHLTNAFRQSIIYQAMGWHVPVFAHIPLIHGADGAKLSKRHGALGVDAYRDMGILPEAVCNYLLRLGWGHGDAELLPRSEAISLFTLQGVGKAPARFDQAKLEHINAHYLREAEDARIIALLEAGKVFSQTLSVHQRDLLMRALPGLKPRAKTLLDIADLAGIYLNPRPVAIDDDARAQLDADLLQAAITLFTALSDWEQTTLEDACKQLAEQQQVKLGKLMAPLRVAITGRSATPSMFEVMHLLGREDVLARLADAVVVLR